MSLYKYYFYRKISKFVNPYSYNFSIIAIQDNIFMLPHFKIIVNKILNSVLDLENLDYVIVSYFDKTFRFQSIH